LMELLIAATCDEIVTFVGSSFSHLMIALGTVPYYDHQCVAHRNTASIDFCADVAPSMHFDIAAANMTDPWHRQQAYWCPATTSNATSASSSNVGKLPNWATHQHSWTRDEWRASRVGGAWAARGEWDVNMVTER
jgi:hypothetical protein